MMRRYASRAIALVAAGLFLFAGANAGGGGQGDDLRRILRGLSDLAPEFQSATGHTVATRIGPSMGNTPEAIPNRLKRGEPARRADHGRFRARRPVKEGKVVSGSRVDLARSKIGMAVRAGTPKPDIGTVEAFKRTVLAAKSIAYSDSASGVYLSTVLFPKLGIAEQIAGKSRMIPAEPVGAVVARGDAEIGFQQISELRAVPGVEVVGPLPAEIQKVTVFSAGICRRRRQPEAARALVRFLSSAAAAPVIARTGIEPVNP